MAGEFDTANGPAGAVLVTGGVYVNVARLREEIARRGWSPTDLGRAAGLSAGTMTAVMKGGSVSPRTLRKIAGAFSRQPVVPGLDELLGGAAQVFAVIATGSSPLNADGDPDAPAVSPHRRLAAVTLIPITASAPVLLARSASTFWRLEAKLEPR